MIVMLAGRHRLCWALVSLVVGFLSAKLGRFSIMLVGVLLMLGNAR